jgi:serine/threonine protein kinase/tetratricopeptide (TPR) repeat protein
MFHENQQIGFYTLIKKLGRGGFGEVWLAERRAKFVTTKVAVKLPLDDQIDHEAIKHEATLWEQASGHPNIVPIIDADEYDGQIVIVSEYAPDGSLEGLLKTNGKLHIERAVEMTVSILNGLEFLHSRNIIHRDLKPDNILLQGDTPRIADFGISRVIKTSLHATNATGTPYYMSPEAFKRERTVQTDIWSIGVMLYQMISGKVPFSGHDINEIFYAIQGEDPEPLPDFVPSELKRIIGKSLEKLPENRYKKSSEMREDLRRFARGNSENPSKIPLYEPLPTEPSPKVFWAAADKNDSADAGIKVPVEAEPHIPFVSPQAKSFKSLSPRWKGIIQGSVLMLSTFIIAPVLASLKTSPEIIGFSSIVTFAGGFLRIVYAAFQANQINQTITPKRKGIGQGVVLILSFFLFVPIIAILKVIEVFIYLASATTIIGGIARIIYAVFFQSEQPIDAPESNYNFKSFPKLTDEKIPKWILILMWGIIGVVSGAITFYSPLPALLESYIKYPRLTVFGIVIYLFGEYSTSPAIGKRKRIYSFIILAFIIAVSWVGAFYSALYIGFGIMDSVAVAGFVFGVIWGICIVTAELICWNIKIPKWVYAFYIVLTTGLAFSLGTYLFYADDIVRVFLFGQGLILMAHAIAFSFGNNKKWLISSTAILGLLTAIFFVNDFAKSKSSTSLKSNSNTNSNSYSSNTNYNAANMNIEIPLSVQYANAADKLYEQKKYLEAATNYREAIRLDPKNDNYYNNLGNSLSNQKKYSEAETEYRLAARINPSSARYQNNLGNTLYNQKKYAEAVTFYNEAIKLNPNIDDYYNNLGDSLFRQEKYSEAASQYKIAIRLAPFMALYQYNLGWCFYKQKEYSEAASAFKEAIKISPNDYSYHNDLGNSLYSLSKYSEAETAFKGAIKLSPQNAVLHHNLGNSLYKQSKYSEAIFSYKKAIELDPNNETYKSDLKNAENWNNLFGK